MSALEAGSNPGQSVAFRFENGDRDNFHELSQLASRVPPDLQEGYLTLESTVSQAFLDTYSKYLTPEQIEYFSLPQIIYSDAETAAVFNSEWDDHDNEPRTDSNLGGLYYTSYTIGLEHKGGQFVASYNAGKFAIYPLEDSEVIAVDHKWLIPKVDFDTFTDEAEFGIAWGSMPLYVYTHAFGRVAIHEKVHGVQVFDLPLPIREAAAMYYERQVYVDNGWNPGEASNMRLLAKLYGDFVAEHGDEAHLFMFGNLENEQRRVELLDLIKDLFSPEKIEELSKFSYDPRYPDTYKWVYWKTEPFKDLEAASVN